MTVLLGIQPDATGGEHHEIGVARLEGQPLPVAELGDANI